MNASQQKTDSGKNYLCTLYYYYYYYYYYFYYYYYYSTLGLVWAGTRAQSGDRYCSVMLHPGQVLRGSLPLLSPTLYNTSAIPKL